MSFPLSPSVNDKYSNSLGTVYTYSGDAWLISDSTVVMSGSTGLQGIQGTTGLQGYQGSTGISFTPGETGIQGVTGISGSGIQGETGLPGIQGATGTGSNGVQGITGSSCLAPVDSGWIDIQASCTVVGWSSFTTKQIWYRKIGTTGGDGMIGIAWKLDGTANAASAYFYHPFKSAQTPQPYCRMFVGSARSLQGTTASTTPVYAFAVGSNVSVGDASYITSYRTYAFDGWSSTGRKMFEGSHFYPVKT